MGYAKEQSIYSLMSMVIPDQKVNIVEEPTCLSNSKGFWGILQFNLFLQNKSVFCFRIVLTPAAAADEELLREAALWRMVQQPRPSTMGNCR